MTKPAKSDIDAILHERFPLRPLIEAVSKSAMAYPTDSTRAASPVVQAIEEAQKLRDPIEAMRAKLEAMTTEQVAKLAAESRARQAAQSTAAKAAERARADKKAADAEAKRFYNLPSAKADFEFWVKVDSWTADEAAALLLGRDPRVVDPISLGEELKKPTGFLNLDKPMGPARFHRIFDGLRLLIARAEALAGPRIKPHDLIAWATATGSAIVPDSLLAKLSVPSTAPALEGPESASPESQAVSKGTPKRWTPERLDELRRYREEHNTKAAAQKFNISEALVRRLLPKQRAKRKPAQPFDILTHRIK